MGTANLEPGGGVVSTLLVEVGVCPWQPTPRTREVARYRMADDLPLTGVVEQEGSLFLYRCVLGHAEQVNIWTYTPLLPQEQREIEGASSRRATELIARFGRRPGQIAIAHRSVGLIAVRPLTDAEDADAEVSLLFGALRDYWAALRTHAQRLRRGWNTSPVAASSSA
jgi:hypothetical protein